MCLHLLGCVNNSAVTRRLRCRDVCGDDLKGRTGSWQYQRTSQASRPSGPLDGFMMDCMHIRDMYGVAILTTTKQLGQ